MSTMNGGCQCGRVRYRAEVSNLEAYLCHCRMCQRATGGVFNAFKNLRKSAITWETQPDWYASSPIAKRPFCSTCGTPLGFAYNHSDCIDLTVGSFDDPSGFVPTENFGVESKHPAWKNTSHLPNLRADDHEPLVKRWSEATSDEPS
ncbi:MAG: GFA family protein [Erythrobacter sp.]